jgi:hypothetical protein
MVACDLEIENMGGGDFNGPVVCDLVDKFIITSLSF